MFKSLKERIKPIDVMRDNFGRKNMFDATKALEMTEGYRKFRRNNGVGKYIDNLCNRIADAVYAGKRQVSTNYVTISKYNITNDNIDAVADFFTDKGYSVTVNKTSNLITISWGDIDDE